MPHPTKADPNHRSAAGRLHRLLLDAKGKEHSWSVSKVWANVLGISEQDNVAVLQAVAEILTLVAKAKSEVGANEELNQDLYLRPLKQVEQILSQLNLHTSWSSIAGQLSESTLTALEFCAETLDRFATEAELDVMVLDELRQEIDGILSEVLNAKLSASLEQLIVSKLEEIRHAILMYRVHGAAGLDQVVQKSVGALVLAREEVKKHANTKAVQRFVDLVIKVEEVIERALRLARFAKPVVIGLLGRGDN